MYSAPHRHSGTYYGWPHAWGGDWGEPWRSQSNHWNKDTWADMGDSSDSGETPRPEEPVTVPDTVDISVVDSAVAPAVEIPVTTHEQVTVEVERAETSKVTVSPGAGVNHPTPLELLNRKASQRPPLTYEDRIDRQALANGLLIPPEVYNYLRFGEGVAQPAPHLANVEAAAATGTESSHIPKESQKNSAKSG